MSVVMKIVFSLSLSGSLLILVLFLGKPLFKSRLSRQWQYYIWLVVAARLLLPIAPETSIVGALFTNINQMNRVERVIIQEPTASVMENDDEQFFPMEEDNVISHRESGQNGGRTLSTEVSDSRILDSKTLIDIIKEKLLQNLWIPWLVIALLLLIRKITLYQRFVKYVKPGHR